MKRSNLIILIAAVSVIAVATATCVVVILANYSRNAAKQDDKRVILYASAFDALTKYLSDEDLLQQFTAAELVEESVYGYLNEEDLQALVSKLNDIYSYPISISRGHDRLESQTPYENRDFVYVFLCANYYDRTGIDRGFNTVRIEGFINNNENNVAMYFRYKSNGWSLVKAELRC